MKLNKLAAALTLSVLLAIPISANAQFFNRGINGFFAARPFTFFGPGMQPVFAQPMTGFGGLNGSFNPFAGMIGQGPLGFNPNFTGSLGASFNGLGPLATNFNSGIFPNGGVGTAFTQSAAAGFEPGLGSGTALNPGFDPRFANQGAFLNGQVFGNPNVALNQGALNPFFDPNGGFINPALQFQAQAPIGTDINGNVQAGIPLNGNFTGASNVLAQGINGIITGPTAVVGTPGATIISSPNNGTGLMLTPQNAGSLIQATIGSDGRLHIRYTGDTTIVRSLTFSLLDRNHRPIRMEIINREPAQASLRLTTKTEFYRVVIEYTSGQTETVEGSV